jgi:hypothetical protein
MVSNSNQIKNADGTNATFDSGSDDIRFEKGGLLAPNGKPSNLNATQYELVRTPAFKKWFGDWENDPANASKVVDENGEPLVVYHGTTKDFTIFEMVDRIKEDEFGFGIRDYGAYFTNDKKTAQNYSLDLTKKTKETKLIEKKFEKALSNWLETKSEIDLEIVRDLSKKRVEFNKNLLNLFEQKNILMCFLNIKKPFVFDAKGKHWYKVLSEKVDIALLNKNDGLILENMIEANARIQNTYVVFEPNQIKLADGTNTTFDSGSDDIRYAKGGKTKGDCYLVAGQLALEIKNKDIDYKGTPYLVHAEVKHSAIEGLRYGHAFIEDDENVYDFSNNREIIMPKQLYYYFGDINPRDKKKYRKYTFKQAKEKMLSTGHYGCWDIEVDYEKGGRTIAQTPAPKKDQVKGSDINKKSSSKDLSSAKLIKFDDKTVDAIKNKVKEHNAEHPDKKINLSSAKAVVRRGMGAYSKSHRPTISGGKPNSRVAWGLARLNAFTYKIVNGKSKSGRYSQDDDLIDELGYKVANYNNGGEMSKDIRCINCGWEWNRKDSELWDMYVCHKCGFDNTTFYTSIPINNYSRGGKTQTTNPDYLKMFLDL